MDKLYRIKFYYSIFGFLIPIWFKKPVSILGLAFFLTDFYDYEIDPTNAKKFIGKTILLNHNKHYGKRMRINRV